MKNVLKSVYVYWLVILIPFAFVIGTFFFVNKYYGICLLLLYVVVYRPLVDFGRLRAVNKVKGLRFWKMYLPFYHFKHFKQFYLK